MAPKLAVAALAALTLACLAAPKAAEAAPSKAAEADSATRAKNDEPTKPWSVNGLEPLGQPIALGTTIIGYVRRDQRVYLQARDPSTGDLRWEAEAEAQAPVRAGEWIIYREPAEGLGPGYASLVAADPRTGQQIQRSPSMIFSGTPRSCFDNRAVCVTAAPEPEEPAHGYRLDLISGAFIPSADGIPGEGLIRIGTDVALVRDGTALWRRPDPAATRWTEHPGVWVGATRTGSIGLAATDGGLLWTVPGALSDCGLPPSLSMIRCRAGRIERFDPLTGKAQWSAPLRGPAGVSGDAIVVRGVAISRDTGVRSPVTTAYWCLTSGLARSCGGRGTPPITAWTTVGAVAEGYAIVATPAGYIGMSVDPAP